MTRNDARAFVLFATYGAQPGLTEDDQHFARALERRGVQVCAAAWDDPAAAWSSAAAVVIRSTWDYHLRRADFLAWVARVSAATTLYNDARAVRWNSHKRYLAEIARRGVPVIDTVFASVGSNLDLTAVAREHGWRDVVVKPAVSASAHETRRFDVPDRAEGQAHLDRLLATRLAAAATDHLERGEHGRLMGWVGGEVRATPLVDIVGKPKALDLDLIKLQKVLAQ